MDERMDGWKKGREEAGKERGGREGRREDVDITAWAPLGLRGDLF